MNEDDNTQDIPHQDESAKDNDQPVASNKLDDVKKRALDALTPLIDSLEIDPERKFDICISAMRFTDNKDLAESALQIALKIQEAGTKAEALVELVNEINYLQSS